MEQTIHSIQEIPKLAESLVKFAKDIRVFTFTGDLGAGKTTLIKEICKLLNVDDEPASPSYSIVNEYQAKENKIYHIDLYRLKSLEEAFEVGLEDYLESGYYCFIEWPQIAEDILPDKYMSIRLEKINEFERRCIFEIIKFQK